MKICANCRYIEYSSESEPACGSPQRPPADDARLQQMIRGGPLKPQWMYATTARTDAHLCGQDARWFERKRMFAEWTRAAFNTGEGR